MPHGDPHNITAYSLVGDVGVNISISDVLFGNVWFCAGQSNMGFTMSMVTEVFFCLFLCLLTFQPEMVLSVV